MADALEARVISALAGIRNPRLENDLISSGMVRDLEVAADGHVTFTFLLAPDDPATLVRAARAAVRAVEGVSEVKIGVTNPAAPTARHSRRACRRRPRRWSNRIWAGSSP